MNPKVSVIMPVYNGEKFLREAIQSVLNQTFSDFELIIVNDGSIDNSLDIIKEYAEKDSRIKIINQKNTGIVGALNNALKLSKGDYVARMDADDISLPKRLEKQIEFLEKEKAFICGAWANVIDQNGEQKGKKFSYPPRSWKQIKLHLLRGNPFIHPSILFKKEIYDNEKDENEYFYKNYKNVEDYELWTRIVPKYKSVNLQEYLLNYRIHNNQITKKTNLKMRLDGVVVRVMAIWRLLII